MAPTIRIALAITDSSEALGGVVRVIEQGTVYSTKLVIENAYSEFRRKKADLKNQIKGWQEERFNTSRSRSGFMVTCVTPWTLGNVEQSHILRLHIIWAA